jgi:hypothetical protein
LGKWERDNFGKPVAAVLEEAMEVASAVRVVRTVAVVGAAGAAVGAAYVAWRIGKSIYGWTEDAKDLLPVVGAAATTTPQLRWLRFFGVGDGKGVI